MLITVISDTHGLHHNINLVAGEMLIHAGDITEYGTEEEVDDFINWHSKQTFKYKIFIAGNHDLYFENNAKKVKKKLLLTNIIYLENSGVEIEGVKIWGSPVSPYFLGMAFNKLRGNEIKKVWNKIPDNTDILITHSPPIGIMDNGIGCIDLLNKVQELKPKIHLFGHAHEQFGVKIIDNTKFINAAIVNNKNQMENEEYKLIGKPIVIKYVL